MDTGSSSTIRACACRRPARPPARRAASSRRGPRRPSARAGGRSPGTASPGPSRSSSRRRARRRARELGDRDVHAEADAEVRDPAARARRGRRGSSPPSRASRSHPGRARRRPPRASSAASSSDMPSASTQRTRTRSAVVGARVLERLVHGEVGVVELHVLADERDLDLLARLDRSGRSRPATRRGRPPGLEPELLGKRARRGPSVRARPARGRRRGRPASRSPRAGRRRRRARSCPGSRRELLVRAADDTSGWIPMRRSSLTECCVGFVFSSPAASMNGTSVTWR